MNNDSVNDIYHSFSLLSAFVILTIFFNELICSFLLIVAATEPPIQNDLKSLCQFSCAASQVTSQNILEKQLDNRYYSPCCHELVCDVLKELYSEGNIELDNQKDFYETVKTLVDDYKACGESSHKLGYCSEFNKNIGEAGVSALFASQLRHCLYSYASTNETIKDFDSRMQYLHEAEVNNNFLDICGFYKFNEDECPNIMKHECLYPLMFIEVTKKTTRSIVGKRPQCSVYANLLFGLMNFEKLYTRSPLLGIIISESNFEIRAYFLKHLQNPAATKISEILLYESNISISSIAKLIRVIQFWNLQAHELLMKHSRDNRAYENVLLVEGNVLMRVVTNEKKKRILKSYDYRTLSGKSQTLDSDRRFPTYYFSSFCRLANCRYEIKYQGSSNNDTLSVISYDFLEGCHWPSKASHLLGVWHQLNMMHKENIVHGDIRLSNLVFTENGEGHIIDFDLSGVSGKKSYCSNYNVDINDGERHQDAVPGKLLFVDHDYHSFMYICKQFTVGIDVSSFDDLMNTLNLNPDLDLIPINNMASMFKFAETGSPPKDLVT